MIALFVKKAINFKTAPSTKTSYILKAADFLRDVWPKKIFATLTFDQVKNLKMKAMKIEELQKIIHFYLTLKTVDKMSHESSVFSDQPSYEKSFSKVSNIS